MGSFLGGYSYNPGDLTSKGGINAGLSNTYKNLSDLQSQTIGQRNAESGSVLGGYQGLVDSGGYSPTEKANIEQGTLGGVNASYGSAQDAAQRRLATTHNSAGYGSFMGGLARSKARDLSQAGLQVQSQFANEALQRKLTGLQGLAQMYGVDTSFLNALNSQKNATLGVGDTVQSRSKGILGNIGSALSLPGKLFGL